MILRSWICDNRACTHWFDSYEPNPACPKCRCIRTSWRPAGMHIGGVAKGADAELRALADVFRMNDMNSAYEGTAAKKVKLPDATPATAANVMTFAGGFSAAVNPALGAQCVPTANKIDYKVKAGTDRKLSGGGALGLPAGGPTPMVEARTSGK